MIYVDISYELYYNKVKYIKTMGFLMVYCSVSTMSLVLDSKLHKQLKETVNKNKIKYSSFSDFVRKAIHEKLEREGIKVEKEQDYGF